ncbi:MAG: histidine--tRNA ligase, partial [Calditrichaeota bacterium]|nr:histidine--tRNA ligase [Calditrichota bacterium]
TASVVRAYIQHSLWNRGAVQKFSYISPMFRQERPQQGRLRQFHQFGVEILGTPNPLADVEVIALAMEIFTHLGLTNLTLKINSVGCPKCRPKYKDALREALKDVKDRLCSDCQVRYDTNPLRILDCKKPTCRELTQNVPGIEEYLCEDCRVHFDQVKAGLDALSIPYEVDKRLVRGLDYYTRTAFEIVSTELGSQDAVCGGGRYDRLVAELGGPDLPGVGFAAGMERLLAIMKKKGLFLGAPPHPDVYFVSLGETTRIPVLRLVQALRRQGIRCELDLSGKSMKAQMREANRLNAVFAVIVGEDELTKEKAQVKNLKEGRQEEVPFDRLFTVIREALREP